MIEIIKFVNKQSLSKNVTLILKTKLLLFLFNFTQNGRRNIA